MDIRPNDTAVGDHAYATWTCTKCGQRLPQTGGEWEWQYQMWFGHCYHAFAAGHVAPTHTDRTCPECTD